MNKHVPILSINDRMPFGKHKGRSVESIIYNDAQYLLWLQSKGIRGLSAEVECLAYENLPDEPARQGEHSFGMDMDWASEVGCDYGMNVWGL